MNLTKKFRMLLAAAVVSVTVVSASVAAFAAGSPTAATAAKAEANVTVNTKANGTAVVTDVETNKKTVNLSTVTVDGVEYTTTKIAAKALADSPKTTTVKISYNDKKVTIAKNAFKGSNVKTVKLTGFKYASKIAVNKGAFKGSKVKTIIVSKSMSDRQVLRLAKALKKAGFTGKLKKK